MAAYIFLRWVWLSCILHKTVIFMKAPNVKEFPFVFVLSQSAVCTQDARRANLALCFCAVKKQWPGIHASCILRLARECKRVRTAADNTVRKTIEMGIFLRWELHYFTRITDLWRIYDDQNPPQENVCRRECESVEISGLLQVRFKLWGFENFPPRNRP